MKDTCKYSIDGVAVTETLFFSKKVYALNVAGINYVLEPFLDEIKRQHGCIEYKNDTSVSSVTVHNVSKDLSSRIQKEIEDNKMDY